MNAQGIHGVSSYGAPSAGETERFRQSIREGLRAKNHPSLPESERCVSCRWRRRHCAAHRCMSCCVEGCG
jgi:hypothetical protein